MLLFDTPVPFRRGHGYTEEFADRENYATEADVHRALRSNGWDVRLLGLYDDVRPLLEEVREHRPQVIFNLAETFHDATGLDKNVTALIELLRVPCTGASSAALFLCNDKALCKQALAHAGVPTPRFAVLRRGQPIALPEPLRWPCIVKPLTEEASRGIAAASLVDHTAALARRVRMIHRRLRQDAIVEEYIDGRELYVSVVGDRTLRVLPPREMTFGAARAPRIATYKAKWDDRYRARRRIRNGFAQSLERGQRAAIDKVCLQAYRALNLDSYARFDLRLTADGEVFVIEANANPNLARDDELAQSARKAGIAYPELIRTLVRQALRRR